MPRVSPRWVFNSSGSSFSEERILAITLPVPKTWTYPSFCPCCMNELLEPKASARIVIRVDENVLGFFYEAMTSKRFDPVSVPYCAACAEHIKKYRSPEAIGCLGVLVVIGAFFAGVSVGIWGAVFVVVTPLVLYFSVVVPRRRRAAEQLRGAACCCTGPAMVFSGPTAFVFQNHQYAKAFAELNG